LPFQPTRLIGREAEIAAATARLTMPDVRLLTLTGPPGVGKTRLALAVAAGAAGVFARGTALVELAPLADPTLVPPAIARTLGIREQGVRTLTEQVAITIGDSNLLLVLDNVEHLLAAAPVVAELLAACPGLTVLATSRTPLSLRWEHRYPVAPLSPAAARELFAERVHAVAPDLTLTGKAEPHVARILSRLDGLPLAIELAAARAANLSLSGLAERLAQGIGALTDGARDLPPRQRTLRAAIAWSHDLLAPDEQAIFRRLAVFTGGWTAEAAAAVVEPTPDGPTTIPDIAEIAAGADALASLVEQGLVRTVSSADGEPRFTMLETVREYAAEQLRASDEHDDVRRRHAEFFANLASRTEPGLHRGRLGQRARDRFQDDADNLRAALAWSVETGTPALGLGMLAPLYSWFRRYSPSEGRRWAQQLLAMPGPVEPGVRSRALWAAGELAVNQGDLPTARSVLEESVALARMLDSPEAAALPLSILVSATADPHEAMAHARESVALLREADPPDPFNLMTALNRLGLVAKRCDDITLARAAFDEEAALAAELGDAYMLAQARGNIAFLELAHGGDLEAARVIMEEALPVFHADGDHLYVGVCHTALGRMALRRDDRADAAEHLAAGLAMFNAVGSAFGLLDHIALSAELAHRRGDDVRATRLRAAAVTLRERGGTFERPWWANELVAIDALRIHLGDERFASAWAGGETLTRDAAVTEAQSFLETVKAEGPDRARQPQRAAGLTIREVEVLGLLAAGLSNREIAESLVVSVRTVGRHVDNIYGKIGVHDRGQARQYARERGLIARAPEAGT
jgi:non-specific serine/threonine protein kinase